ncbi:FIVAR domain-containing protein, partial [Staphylococcus epidermidis]
VNQIKGNANAVNTAMTGLKQSVADNDSEIQQGNYINADKDKQDAYNSAVNQAKQIINESNKINAQLNPSEISKITEKVNSTKNDLNGNN